MVDTTKTSNSKSKPADSAKDRALDSMLRQIERQFGKGSVMRMGDGQAEKIESISTGSQVLIVRLVLVVCPRPNHRDSMVLNHQVKPH